MVTLCMLTYLHAAPSRPSAATHATAPPAAPSRAVATITSAAPPAHTLPAPARTRWARGSPATARRNRRRSRRSAPRSTGRSTSTRPAAVLTIGTTFLRKGLLVVLPCASTADAHRCGRWRAPGAAPVFDSCGMAGGHKPPDGGFGGIYVNTSHATEICTADILHIQPSC